LDHLDFQEFKVRGASLDFLVSQDLKDHQDLEEKEEIKENEDLKEQGWKDLQVLLAHRDQWVLQV
jgi:hypothetical protein